MRSNEGPVLGEFTGHPGGYERLDRDTDRYLGNLFLEAEARLFADLLDGASFPEFRSTFPDYRASTRDLYMPSLLPARTAGLEVAKLREQGVSPGGTFEGTQDDRRADTSELYTGAAARRDERRRVLQISWHRENLAVEQCLGVAKVTGRHVLDVPIGTGRFLPELHRRGARVTGVDASSSMLWEAAVTADRVGLELEDLRLGDAKDLPFDDASFDLSLCVRLLHLLPPSQGGQVLAECARVARRHVLIGIRLRERWPVDGLDARRNLRALVAAARREGVGEHSIAYRRRRVEGWFNELELDVLREKRITGPAETPWVIYLLQRRSLGAPASRPG